MQPHRVYANPSLRANAGRTALQRGPLVYCFEEQDNGAPLASLSLKADSDLREVPGGWREGVIHLEAEGCRRIGGDDPEELYSVKSPVKQPVKLTAIPYTLWGNRTPGEMLLWIREEA
ncbi:Non-reducing end beta-L-arabinofuranosidase [compost metagenome]